MQSDSWQEKGPAAVEGFGGYELWSGLKAFEPKYEYPANLTVFTQWAEDADEGQEMSPPDEVLRTKLVAFQDSLAGRLKAVCETIAYARFWHAGICQMEFRVDAPEKANEALQAIIESEDHAFPFQFRLFPDGQWSVPKAYWNGSIAEADSGEPDEEEEVDEDEDEDEDEDAGEAASPALDAIQEGDLQRAVELLKEDLAGAGAENPQTWEMLCDCLADLGMFEEAERTGREGLERFPNEPRLLRALSTAYFLADALEKAEAVVVNGLNADSLNPAMHHQMACIRVKQGRMEEALESVRICSKIDPFRKLDLRADDDLAPLRDYDAFHELTDSSDLAIILGGRHTDNPHERILVVEIPEGLDPEERAETIEDPLGEQLAAARAGTILGGATRLHPGQDQRETLIEVGTDSMDTTIKIISDFLIKVGLGDNALIFPDKEIRDPLDPDEAIEVVSS